jgi:dihydroorotate dehydrogenase
MLAELLAAVDAERQKLKGVRGKRVPRMLLKLAPDLTQQQLEEVAAVINGTSAVDGVIVSNTTIQRPASLVSGAFVAF